MKLDDFFSPSRTMLPAIKTRRYELSYGDLEVEVFNSAEKLKENNLTAGAVVALSDDDPLNFVSYFLAALSLDLCILPLDSSLNEHEIAKILQYVRPFLKIDSNSQFQTFENSREIDASVIQFTSGSTGQPKGIVLKERALSARYKNLAKNLSLTSDDRTLCTLPLSHSHGLDCLALPTLYAGGCLHLISPQNANPQAVLECIDVEEITFFSSVPLFYRMCLELKPDAKFRLQSLRHMFCGSAAISPSTLKDFSARYGRHITQGYGLAEIGVICTYHHNSLRDGDSLQAESVGTAIEGIQMRVDQESQLLAKGEALFDHYLDNPALSQKMLVNGELQTQDLAQINSDGLVYILGRKSDFINVGGNKLSPLEIENLLSVFPELKSFAAIGRIDPDYGEVPVLHIEFSGSAEEQEMMKIKIMQRLRSHLAKFKIPREIIFSEQLPKSSLGKVLKAKLP